MDYVDLTTWYNVKPLGGRTYRTLGHLCGAGELYARPYRAGWLVIDAKGTDYEILTDREARSALGADEPVTDPAKAQELDIAVEELGPLVDACRRSALPRAPLRPYRAVALAGAPVELPPEKQIPI